MNEGGKRERDRERERQTDRERDRQTEREDLLTQPIIAPVWMVCSVKRDEYGV